MSSQNDNPSSRGLDWRVVLGASLTAIWLLLGIVYLFGKVGIEQFIELPTGEIGSFLEGAFAPLAFLWLVIGHFMQQSEISATTKAVQLQEQSSKRQEVHSQRNSYFKLLSLVQDQLGAIAGFHYISVCGETGTNEVSSEQYANMRAESAAGDSALFVRKMVSMIAGLSKQPDAVKEVLFGTEIRTRHTNNFQKTFRKLLESARAVDQDEMVENALLYGSAWGMYYRIILTAKGEEEIDPLTGFATLQSKT